MTSSERRKKSGVDRWVVSQVALELVCLTCMRAGEEE